MQILNASMLLVMLLNPFLVILYLMDIVKKQPFGMFARNLVKAGIYSSLIFVCFAGLGDMIFRDILKTNFASFQVFGGVIFLIIGVNFVFHGTSAIDALRGESSDVSGAIAMPILVGPGTISASVLIGQRLTIPQASLAIVITVMFSVTVMIGLKSLHDYIQKKREIIVERYIEVAGRILALYIGTISIDMIMRGMQKWVVIIFDCL